MKIPESIDPKIIRSQRRTIALQVMPGGELLVKAPLRVSMRDIQNFISKNLDWIEQHQRKMEKFAKPIARQYQDGEEFYFLGKPLKLSIGDSMEIKVYGEKLLFPKAAAFRIKKDLPAWYIRQAREIISKQVALYAKEMNASYNDLTFSDTKSQWGRCTHDNRLQFNWRLVMAPMLVINYVVVHELVHTKEKNHRASFWSKVRLYNPSYKQQIKWLKEHGGLLTI